MRTHARNRTAAHIPVQEYSHHATRLIRDTTLMWRPHAHDRAANAAQMPCQRTSGGVHPLASVLWRGTPSPATETERARGPRRPDRQLGWALREGTAREYTALVLLSRSGKQKALLADPTWCT